MKQRPIIFSAPMVQAILAGRKTQTRRIAKCIPDWDHCGKKILDWGLSCHLYQHNEKEDGKLWGVEDREWIYNIQTEVDDYECHTIKCPYGKIGDQLWVRETFSQCLNLGFDKNGNAPENLFSYSYKADGGALIGDRWKPSIHMPREASRILLEITDIRVERLQDISEADAKAEGSSKSHPSIDKVSQTFGFADWPRSWFAQTWDHINGADSWAENPWVWCVSFKVVEPQGGDL